MNRTEWSLSGGRFLRLLAVAVAVASAASLPATRMAAQESRPRLTLGGRGLVSVNLDRTRGLAPEGGTLTSESSTVSDFSDTFVLLRLDQLLYGNDRVGMVVGFLFPDADTDLGQVFYDQINVFYDARTYRVQLGRTRLGNFLVEFPTLREEDVLEYGYVLNAFSDAENSEFSRYGNVIRGELFRWNSRVILRAQAANWAVTDRTGKLLDQFDVNAAGASLTYRLPEALRYQGVVRDLSVGIQSQNLDEPGQAWIHSVMAAAAVNLSRHPLRSVTLTGQIVRNFGMDGVDAAELLTSPQGRARASSTALLGSLRVLLRPYQLDRLQAAVTAGYKAFDDIDASRFTVLPNLFFRLGQGVDLGIQYQYERLGGMMAQALGNRDRHSLKLTLALGFTSVFNDYFGERDDILNIEHGFIR